MQTYLGTYSFQRFSLEVVHTHPWFNRPEGMFNSLFAQLHHRWVLVHSFFMYFKYLAMFPSRDSSLFSCRAFWLQLAVCAVWTPVTPHYFVAFTCLHSPWQSFSGRALVFIILLYVNKVSTVIQPFWFVVGGQRFWDIGCDALINSGFDFFHVVVPTICNDF